MSSNRVSVTTMLVVAPLCFVCLHFLCFAHRSSDMEGHLLRGMRRVRNREILTQYLVALIDVFGGNKRGDSNIIDRQN